MSTQYAKQIELACYPEGIPRASDFQLREIALPALAEGEVLCATEYLSLDPYMRSQIAGRHISGTISPGDRMQGETVSRVLESRSPDFQPGQRVRCFGGWATHSIQPGDALSLLSDDFPEPASLALSTLGMPGLTAWAGLRCLASMREGSAVLIPAATGAVGAVAGQLAKNAGCRVIGIAGGPQKCQLAVEKLGYSACIDRHEGSLGQALDEHFPDGIDIFFDLVGGELLNLASERLAVGGEVILCGLMAEYNSSERAAGPPPGLWIRARARVYGLVVYDFESRRSEFLEEAIALYRAGKLISNEDISYGIEAAPEAFARLMRGENRGKALVTLNPDG
ncbi:MAG: NADP-dependent oxidoreductase [Congregibacter sp.]